MSKKIDRNYITEYLATLIRDKHISTLNDFLRIPNKEISYNDIKKVFVGWTEAKKESLQRLNEIATGDNDSVQLLKKHSNYLTRKLKEEKVKTQYIIDACKAAILKLDLKPVKIRKDQIKSKANQTMFCLRSDEQVGMVLEGRNTQNISNYNFETYKVYLQRWLEKVVSFKRQDEKSLGLNKLVIVRLGDHVEGETIYPGQSFYIEQAAVDQVFNSVYCEAEVIRKLASEFRSIEIFCVSGNHGRVGKKGESHSRTNWDYIFNQVLKILLQNQTNVTVYVSEGPVMIVQHGKFNFLYKHGHNVKSWMNLPYYGLSRDFNRIQTLYNMRIDYECVGHFHQPANIGDNIIINGSFPGGTDLSINQMSVACRPSQKLFYLDDNYGINRESNLYLNDQWVLKSDKNGIYTEYS